MKPFSDDAFGNHPGYHEAKFRWEREINMKNYRFSVVLERDAEGYFVFCPELQGCYSQGGTYEKALVNIQDAIQLHVTDRLESGQEVSQVGSISLTSMEVRG